MARRPGEEGTFSLGPRERRILGWIVAIVLLVGVAIAVGLLGGNGDGTPIDPAAGASPSRAAGLPIAFGTEFDAGTGEVAADAQTDRFTSADTFAYSVRPPGPVPATVFVEVERIGGGALETVQPATPDGEQQVTPGRPAVAFSVPVADLLEVFGPGEYRMRIFLDPAGEPLAEGTFTLVADVLPASAAPTGSP